MPGSHRKGPAEEYRGIKVYEIERFGRLVPMKRLLNERWGEGKWGRDQIVDLMLERRANKEIVEGRAVAKVLDKRRDRVKVLAARVEVYRRAFPSVTPNDTVLIEQLCELELQLDELTDDQLAAEQSDAGDTIDAKSKRGGYRLKLVAEHRKIQNELGIGRSARQNELDAAQVIKGMADASRKLIAERTVPIRCKTCGKEHALNMGFLLIHYMAHVPWQYRQLCPNPKCRAVIQLGDTDARFASEVARLTQDLAAA